MRANADLVITVNRQRFAWKFMRLKVGYYGILWLDAADWTELEREYFEHVAVLTSL